MPRRGSGVEGWTPGETWGKDGPVEPAFSRRQRFALRENGFEGARRPQIRFRLRNARVRRCGGGSGVGELSEPARDELSICVTATGTSTMLKGPAVNHCGELLR